MGVSPLYVGYQVRKDLLDAKFTSGLDVVHLQLLITGLLVKSGDVLERNMKKTSKFGDNANVKSYRDYFILSALNEEMVQ